MKKYISILGAATLMTACATEPYPTKRPLTPEIMTELGETDIVVVQPNSGITASWFMQDSSAAGAGYGLIGALTVAVMDAIANAGPSRRATRVASEVYETIDPDFLSASLTESFAALEINPEAGYSVMPGSVRERQGLLETQKPWDTIDVATSYMLAENASAFSVTAYVTVARDDISYASPYIFEGDVPKEQQSGDLYKNTFTYASKRFPVPILTAEMKEDLVVAIEDSYRDADGNLPEADSKEAKELTKEIEKARDNKLTKSEASIFMVNNWVADDGAELKAELTNAHDFIAKYVLADLNNPDVPSLDGSDQIIDTADDGRVVLKIGAGIGAGSYASRPGGVSDFITYGNAIAGAPEASKRMKMIERGEDTSS